MPELPEVETVRRGLEPAMVGARFEAVETRRSDLRSELPERFSERLIGAKVQNLTRRGKYLVAPLSSGETLIMHLGMSGRFTVRPTRPGPARLGEASSDFRHDHVVFTMSGRGKPRVVFNDSRRFGMMDLTADPSTCRHLAGMGPEPLGSEFTAELLNDALRTKRQISIKAALLDQHVVAGIGNIYACEALFQAGISPKRTARTVAGARGERLRRAVIDVLSEAIEFGGSTLKDFASADGSAGYFQHRFRVYGREGAPCSQCGSRLVRIVQSGRSTFYCRGCQK